MVDQVGTVEPVKKVAGFAGEKYNTRKTAVSYTHLTLPKKLNLLPPKKKLLKRDMVIYEDIHKNKNKILMKKFLL